MPYIIHTYFAGVCGIVFFFILSPTAMNRPNWWTALCCLSLSLSIHSANLSANRCTEKHTLFTRLRKKKGRKERKIDRIEERKQKGKMKKKKKKKTNCKHHQNKQSLHSHLKLRLIFYFTFCFHVLFSEFTMRMFSMEWNGKRNQNIFDVVRFAAFIGLLHSLLHNGKYVMWTAWPYFDREKLICLQKQNQQQQRKWNNNQFSI